MILLLGCAFAFVLYFYARKRYGKIGAIISLWIFCFSPNILAHSRIATVDLGFGFFLFLAVVSLSAYWNKPSWKNAFFAGLFLGLAQISKFSALLILPFYFLVWLEILIRQRKKLGAKIIGKRVGELALIFSLMCLIICAEYGFKEVFSKPSELNFYSQTMRSLADAFGSVPVPLPKTYLKGLDAQLLDAEQGEFANYLLGKWYRGCSRKYFLVALFVKVPIAVQVLFLMLLIFSFSSKFRFTLAKEELLILAICAWVLFVFSTKSVLQIGIRYLVPFFPLAFLLIGKLGSFWEKLGLKVKGIIVGMLFWLMLESLLIYPHYLSYFNEFCGGAGRGHKVLLDSNLDWGQDLPALKKFMERNGIEKIELCYFGHPLPELYGINYQPLGFKPRLKYCAISVQLLLGAGHFYYPLLYYKPEQTLYYHKAPLVISPEIIKPYLKKTPIAKCGYSIWVFRND